VQLLSRVHADRTEKVRSQQPDTTVPGVLRPGQKHHENGLQVPKPGGGGQRDVGQRHGLPLRVQHAVLVGREAEEDQVSEVAGRGQVRAGWQRHAARDHVAGNVGTHFGGGGLGRQQTVRSGRCWPEGGRVRAERPVARDRAEQQLDQSVGHRARSHPRVHVHSGRQPVNPRQHGRRRHQSHSHRRCVQGVRRFGRHTRQAVVLV